MPQWKQLATPARTDLAIATGQPSHLAGLAGLATLLAACVLAAMVVFGRSDVSG